MVTILQSPRLAELQAVVGPMSDSDFQAYVRDLAAKAGRPLTGKKNGEFGECDRPCARTGGWTKGPKGELIACPCRAQRTQSDMLASVAPLSPGMSPEMRRWTLENSPADPKSVAAAREVVEQPFGLVTFWSQTFGTGKTGLLSAIYNACMDHHLPAIYYTVPDLLDELRGAYYDDSYDDLMRRFQGVRVLLLDEFHRFYQARKGKGDEVTWAAEKMFMLIDHRYRFAGELLTVLATNAQPDRGDDPISSRLTDALHSRIVHVDGDDIRPVVDVLARGS